MGNNRSRNIEKQLTQRIDGVDKHLEITSDIEPIDQTHETDIYSDPVYQTIEMKTDDEPVVVTRTVGSVVGCPNLNVRETASPEAKVLLVIPQCTKVEITDDSDKDFYGVVTESGAIGYCAKRYIEVK